MTNNTISIIASFIGGMIIGGIVGTIIPNLIIALWMAVVLGGTWGLLCNKYTDSVLNKIRNKENEN